MPIHCDSKSIQNWFPSNTCSYSNNSHHTTFCNVCVCVCVSELIIYDIILSGSGGINLTVVGSSLSSVAMPILRIMMTQFLNDGTQNVTLFHSVITFATYVTPSMMLIKYITEWVLNMPSYTIHYLVSIELTVNFITCMVL